MRISDWSSDVCSSDLHCQLGRRVDQLRQALNLTQQLCGRCPAPESFPNHHMAIQSCHSSTTRSAIDAMSSQISNRIQVAILSCPISTKRSTVDAMSSKVANHIQMARHEFHTNHIGRAVEDMSRSEERREGTRGVKT